uniref:Uncharacterized protein n=1 Tax=Arundo donax TaxID=35708 RepID=A0A0A9BSP5_ARUDO
MKQILVQLFNLISLVILMQWRSSKKENCRQLYSRNNWLEHKTV